MITEPVLEQSTKARLLQLLENPPHALLLTGPVGMGKATIAAWLIEQLQVGPHVLTIEPEKGKASIGIEAVRAIEHFLSLRLSSTRTSSRVVRIDNANNMTVEAQNAILKTLEEPPEGTMIVMTSSQQEALLSTIKSRVQGIEIRRPPADQLVKALPKKQEAKKIMALSGGLPGLAFALSLNDQTHPLIMATEFARELLQGSSFTRLATVDKLAKDKEATANTLYMLMQMAHAALLTGRGAERWRQVLKATYQAETDMKHGAQPKLALTKLMLSL